MPSIYGRYPNRFWRAPVASAVNLPAQGNTIGDVIITLDTDTIYVWNGSSWIAVATPGAAIALDGLIGDVLATGPGVAPATVAFVGGSSAANVHTAELAANAATSSNTASTIVKRNASGNFSAGTITAVNAINISSLTAKSILFSGAAGLISQDNTNLNYNSSTIQLGVGALPSFGGTVEFSSVDPNQLILVSTSSQVNTGNQASLTFIPGTGVLGGGGMISFKHGYYNAGSGAEVHFTLEDSNAFTYLCVNPGQNSMNIGKQGYESDSTLQIFNASGAGNTRLAVKAGSTQSLNLTEWRSNSDVVQASIDPVGNLSIKTIGSGISIAEGSNARMGISTLVAGTVTVSNTSVTASTRIFLTAQNNSGTPGFLSISSRIPGTSFVIASSSNADTSNVAWIMFEPA